MQQFPRDEQGDFSAVVFGRAFRCDHGVCALDQHILYFAKLGGGTFELLGDTIERQFQNVNTYHTGAAISLVMMVLILISMAIMNRFTDEPEEEVLV